MNIRVSQNGDGDFKSINEAIASSSPGARIHISTGVYDEALVFTNPIFLVGDADGLVVLRHPEFCAIKVENTEVILENLAIMLTEGRRSIETRDARLQLRGCAFVSDRVDLAQTKSMSTFMADGKARAATSLWDKDGDFKGVKNTQQPPTDSFEKIVNSSNIRFCNSTITVAGSYAVGATIGMNGGSLTVEGTAFVTTQLTLINKAESCIDKSLLFASIVICNNSSLRVSGTSHLAIGFAGFLCNTAIVEMQECRLEGIMDADNVGIRVKGESDVKIAKTEISRCGDAIRAGVQNRYPERFDGTVRLDECSIVNNRNGVDVNAANSNGEYPNNACAIIENSTVSNNAGTGLRFQGGTYKRKLSIWLSKSEISHNRGRGIYIDHNVRGKIVDCKVIENGDPKSPFPALENLFCLPPTWRLTNVERCEGIGESKLTKAVHAVRWFTR
jgi:hypothetical protein